MRKKIICILIGCIFFVSLFSGPSSSLSLNIIDKNQTNLTIYVDDDGTADYDNIQDAINAANSGDTVFVYSGTYNEHISIDKSIMLEGEDRESTIISGVFNDNVIKLYESNIEFKGFTVKNSGSGSVTNIGIVAWSGVNNCIISDNIITENEIGIWLQYCLNFEISDNIISNSEFWGVDLKGENNQIINNEFINNHGSIQASCIRVYEGNNNYISNNILDNNDEGIFLIQGNGNEIFKNRITNISDNGIKGSSNNCLIYDNIIKYCNNGINLYLCSGCEIYQNIITKNSENGVYLETCLDTSIHSNSIYRNKKCGVYLDSSEITEILQNDICYNTFLDAKIYFEHFIEERDFDYSKIGSNDWSENYFGKNTVAPKQISGKLDFYEYIHGVGKRYVDSENIKNYDENIVDEPYNPIVEKSKGKVKISPIFDLINNILDWFISYF